MLTRLGALGQAQLAEAQAVQAVTSKVKTNRNTLMGCLCALGCETLFGFSYLFTKDATTSASALALLG